MAGNAVLRDFSDWRRGLTELMEVHLEMSLLFCTALRLWIGVSSEMNPQNCYFAVNIHFEGRKD